MDIKGTEDKLNQVDSLLTTLTKLLKKHWIILSLISIGAFVYWAINLPETTEIVNTEQVDSTYQPANTDIGDYNMSQKTIKKSNLVEFTDSLVSEDQTPIITEELGDQIESDQVESDQTN